MSQQAPHDALFASPAGPAEPMTSTSNNMIMLRYSPAAPLDDTTLAAFNVPADDVLFASPAAPGNNNVPAYFNEPDSSALFASPAAPENNTMPAHLTEQDSSALFASPAFPEDSGTPAVSATPSTAGQETRRLNWSGNNNMMRCALAYMFTTKYSTLNGTERTATFPAVFSLAFRDQLDAANIEGDVRYGLLSAQWRERTRMNPPRNRQWVFVLDPNQTGLQHAAAAEARERVDAAEAILADIHGLRALDEADPQLRAAVDAYYHRVMPADRKILGERIELMNDNQLVLLLEAIFPDVDAGEAAALVISTDNGAFVKLHDIFEALMAKCPPAFQIFDTFTHELSPFKHQPEDDGAEESEGEDAMDVDGADAATAADTMCWIEERDGYTVIYCS